MIHDRYARGFASEAVPGLILVRMGIGPETAWSVRPADQAVFIRATNSVRLIAVPTSGMPTATGRFLCYICNVQSAG